MRDTGPAAEQVQLDALRRMAPAERIRLAFELSESVRRVTLAGLRARHPDRTDLELVAAIASAEDPELRAALDQYTRPLSFGEYIAVEAAIAGLGPGLMQNNLSSMLAHGEIFVNSHIPNQKDYVAAQPVQPFVGPTLQWIALHDRFFAPMRWVGDHQQTLVHEYLHYVHPNYDELMIEVKACEAVPFPLARWHCRGVPIF